LLTVTKVLTNFSDLHLTILNEFSKTIKFSFSYIDSFFFHSVRKYSSKCSSVFGRLKALNLLQNEFIILRDSAGSVYNVTILEDTNKKSNLELTGEIRRTEGVLPKNKRANNKFLLL